MLYIAEAHLDISESEFEKLMDYFDRAFHHSELIQVEDVIAGFELGMVDAPHLH